MVIVVIIAVIIKIIICVLDIFMKASARNIAFASSEERAVQVFHYLQTGIYSDSLLIEEHMSPIRQLGWHIHNPDLMLYIDESSLLHARFIADEQKILLNLVPTLVEFE
jgi:hypothetical protein